MRKLLSFWIALALLIGCAVPALPWWQSIQQVGVGGGGGVATAFDPATAFGQLAFASSNTNVSHTGGGNTSDGVWTVAGTTTNQKVYVETAIGGVAFTILMGFSNDKTLSGNRFGGANLTPTKGWIVGTGGVFQCADSVDNSTAVVPSVTAGDTLDWAFDTAAGVLKGWVRKNNGAWNASLGGTQDPGTGQGGFATTVTGGGPYFFFYGADGANGDQVTATFASGSWARTPPSGFSQLH